MTAKKEAKVKSINPVISDKELQGRIKKVEKEIGDALSENMQKFLNGKWSDTKLEGNPIPNLPASLIEDFDKSFYAIPFAFNSVSIKTTKEILATKHEDLTYAQVSMIMPVIAGTEPKSYTTSKEDYIGKREQYDMIYRILTPLEEEATASNNRLEAKIKNKYDQDTWLPKYK